MVKGWGGGYVGPPLKLLGRPGPLPPPSSYAYETGLTVLFFFPDFAGDQSEGSNEVILTNRISEIKCEVFVLDSTTRQIVCYTLRYAELSHMKQPDQDIYCVPIKKGYTLLIGEGRVT